MTTLQQTVSQVAHRAKSRLNHSPMYDAAARHHFQKKKKIKIKNTNTSLCRTIQVGYMQNINTPWTQKNKNKKTQNIQTSVKLFKNVRNKNSKNL